jgi:catechol 2,3-dioxygenase-like lactoylglutathione lyase family enzyme
MLQPIETLVDQFQKGRLSRRELVAALGLLAAGGCAAYREDGQSGGKALPPGSAPSPISVRGYSHAALKVSSVARSREFYARHFGMRVTSEGASSAFLSMGATFLALFAPGSGHSTSRDPGLDHLAFSVEGWDFDRLVAALRERGLEPWTQDRRIYFRDPDGIILQVSP